MINLHYEELRRAWPDLRFEPEELRERTYAQLTPFCQYLDRAKAWLLNSASEVEWLATSEPEKSEQVSAGDPLRVPSPQDTPPALLPTWILLREPDSDQADDIMDDFLETRMVFEARRGGRGIKVLQRNRDLGVLLLSRRPTSTRIYYRPDTRVVQRQRTALARLQNGPSPAYRGLLRLMEPGTQALWPPVEPAELHESDWELLTDRTRSGTDEQRRFVEVALGTPDFAVLVGPPGSGKTVTICEYILQEIRRGSRVLLCASTHVAVDNVLEKLHDRQLTENEVIAVRVGDEGRVSEIARDFLLSRWIDRDRERLVHGLEETDPRSPSQEYLLQALREQGVSLVQQMVLECANLVCGTTNGILAHPDLGDWDDPHKSSQPAPPPPYDVLIVDECSKTTFSEFLVPALLARKWVVVGDPKQLSPYVDTRYLRANLDGMVPREDAAICAPFLDAPPRSGGILLAYPDPARLEKARLQAEGLRLDAVVMERDARDAGPRATLELWGSQVAIVDSARLRSWEPFLPADLLNHSRHRLPLHERKANAWRREHRRQVGPKGHPGPLDSPEAREWSEEVAWRLTRAFELRGDPPRAKERLEEIDRLIPRWYAPSRGFDSPDAKGSTQGEIRQNLEIVYKATFPSILEILLEGLPPSPGTLRSETTNRLASSLQAGLRQALTSRQVTLTFQHRMHPEISRIPRDHVYEGGALNDANGIEEERAWVRPLVRYPSRACWFDVQGTVSEDRNENRVEAEALIEELQVLRRWFASSPPPDRQAREQVWQVAVLTFYLAQERLLRRALQSEFGTRSLHRFTDPKARLEVRLAVVDRFQGQEADVVLLSMVRTFPKTPGFLDNPNRMNVALTRARYQLVIFGDRGYFAHSRKAERAELCRIAASTLKGGIAVGGGEKNLWN